MIRLGRIGFGLLLMVPLASVKGVAQSVAAPSSIVIQATPWSSLSYQVAEIDGREHARQSVFKNTGWRTAIFAAGGGLLAGVIVGATTDEPGIKSAEITAFVAGAATGAVFSLLVWPALFGKN